MTMKTAPLGVLSTCCALALVHVTQTSHALTKAADQIYSDARELAIDLIETEVAKSGASLMVCRAPAFLLYYFPSTLQTMRQPPLDMDALGQAARTDAAELAGDWFRQSVRHGGMVDLATIARQATEKLNNQSGLDDIGVKCQHQPDEQSSADLQGILRKFLEYRQTNVPSPLSDCAGPYTKDGGFDSEMATSCELGLAVRAAVMGDTKASQSHLVGALMVPATRRVAGTYKDWSQMRDTALSLLNASEDRFQTSLATAFNGSTVAPDLRALADHIRTTFRANGSPAALQQLVVNALDESKAFLESGEKDVVDRVLAIVRDKQFLRLLEAVQSGEGHRIIIEAVDTGALAISPTSADSDDARQRAAIKAALAVLKYATEAHANRTVAESTRAAAREALFTYLAENGEGGYTSRKGFLGASWGIEPLTASLGASFSSGYVNSDVQGLRTPVSVEAVVLKVGLSQKHWSYFGLHFSALNLLGYPAEIVLRDPHQSFSNEISSHILGLTLHPRLDFVYGVPSFSRRIALFAGIGMTTVAPIKLTDGSYGYASLFHHRPSDTAGEFGPRFFDVGIGIRYYPF